jgi:SOS response regulatory protein OraA/RecX
MGESNYKRQLVNYFKKNLSKNYTSDSLRLALVSQGYSRTAIEKALEQAHKELAEEAPKFKEKPKIKYEIIDEDNKPVTIQKSFWKRIFGL